MGEEVYFIYIPIPLNGNVMLFMLGLAFILIVQCKKLLKTRLQVEFVMINDETCCNSTNISRIKCKSKYCMAKLMSKIVNKIDNAQNAIYIAMYTLTNDQLVKCILNARARSVSVRLIVDKSMFEGDRNQSEVMKLTKAGK